MRSFNKKLQYAFVFLLLATPNAYSENCPIDITEEARQYEIRQAQSNIRRFGNRNGPQPSMPLTAPDHSPQAQEDYRIRNLQAAQRRLNFFRSCRVYSPRAGYSCSSDPLMGNGPMAMAGCLGTSVNNFLNQGTSSYLAFTLNYRNGQRVESTIESSISPGQLMYSLNNNGRESNCHLVVRRPNRRNRVSIPSNYVVRITDVISAETGIYKVEDDRRLFSEMRCPIFGPTDSQRCYGTARFATVHNATACSPNAAASATSAGSNQGRPSNAGSASE